MTMKTEPFLSGKWGWDLGEGDWKDGADENFLKFSYMLNGNVDGFVPSLPSSPTNGTAYFLTSDATLNARIEGVWYKFPTPKGFVVTDKNTGDKYEFNGSAFVATLNALDKVKLNGITAGATVNSTDAALRDRNTHTGAQAISTVTGLQTALDAKAPSNNPTLTGTVTVPTVATGDDSNKAASTAFVKAQNYLTAGSGGMVTSVAGRGGDVLLTPTDVGLENVNNTSDSAKPVSTLQQNALDLKANKAGPTFTGVVVLPSTTSIGPVSSTEISYLDGVTSNIQGQIDSITGVTGGYAPINNPSFTGTVSGVTKSMVGLGNVDNTSDISKPISTATQSALNAKQATLSGTGFVKSTAGTISYDTTAYAPLASPSFTGTVTLPSTTSIGSVTSTQLGYLVNTTSDIQSQLNTKAPSSAPTFQSAVTINAASGQSSLYLSQAGTNNGRIYAGGGAGTDVIIESGRFITLRPTSNVLINFAGVDSYNFSAFAFTLPTSGRITGDFSNTTNASRVLVQTNVANSVTRFDVVPNGTSTTATVGAFNNSDPTNAAWVRLTATATDTRVESTVSGTGTALPLGLYTGGSSRLNVFTNGNVAIGTGTDNGYKFEVNGIARVTGDFTTNGNLQVNKAAPVMINSSTTAPVASMTNYISFRDNSSTEQGWMGYGAANGELGFNNAGRNIRFLSPVVLNSTLSATGAIESLTQIKAKSAGNTSPNIYDGQLYIESGANNHPSIGFHSNGVFGGVIKLSTIGFNFLGSGGTTYTGVNTGNLKVNGSSEVTGESFSPRFIAGLATASGVLDAGFRVTDGATYNYGMCVPAPTGGLDFHANQSGVGSFRWYSGSFATPTVKMILHQTGNLELLVGNYNGNGSGLTTLNASNISSGTLSTARLPFTLDTGVSSNTVVQRDGSGNIGVAGINASTTVSASSFSGNGALLVNLNASALVTGTVPDARLSSNVALVSTVVTKATPSQTTQTITHSSSGTLTINLALGTDVLINVSANITGIAFTNAPSTSEAWSATLEFVTSGTRTISWPSGSRSAGGTLPTLTANATDIYVIRKRATDSYTVFTSGKAMA